jgi:peroxiredoxin
MHTLENGTVAPTFSAADLDGNTLDLTQALAAAPAIVCFAHPTIFASRLVVGYLRRMKEFAPTVPVWIISLGSPADTLKYARPNENTVYLDMPVVVDDCTVAKQYGVTHLPTTYLIGQDGRIIRGYTGFNKPFLNTVAIEAATLTGAKPKELIADGDNKGFYELAERGPC